MEGSISIPQINSDLNNVHLHKVTNGNQTEYHAIRTKEGNLSNKLDSLTDIATIQGIVQGEPYNPGVKNENLPKFLSVV